MNDLLRVLPDSNIVFSAVRDLESSFLALWNLLAVEVLISQFIIAEVSRHFPKPEHRSRLWQLVYRSHLIPDGDEVILPAGLGLPKKDQPILRSAIAAQADILITGDRTHFGPLFGTVVEGVLIERTREFKLRFPKQFGMEGVFG